MVFKYTKNPNDKTPIIVVNKHIGSNAENGEGIMGGQFLDEVFELRSRGAKRAEVWVNSPGGSMMEAYDITVSMERLPCDTLNYGVAASSSGWIWLKGKTVRMTPNAIFMCHNPSGGDENVNGSEQKAFTYSVAKMISDGSGRNGQTKLTVEAAEELMNNTTFLTAEECLNIGLCDEVIPEGEFEANYKPITANDFFLAGNKILNSLLQKNNIMAADTNLLLIVNALDNSDITEESSSKEVAKAIKNLKTKANRVDVLEETNKSLTTQVADLTKVKNEMEDSAKEKDDAYAAKDNEYMDMKNKHDALMTECNSLKEKMDAFEVSKKEREAAAEVEATKRNETDCVNMVNTFKNKLGTDEAYIAEWVNTAKEFGLEKTKTMLEKLPFNGKAPKINEIVTKVDRDGIHVDKAGKTPAQVLMEENRIKLQEKRNRSKTSIQ